MASAIVFAYSEVGARCLQVLLDRQGRVDLLFTHEDDPSESQWFASVAQLAAAHGIRCVTPADPNQAEWIEAGRRIAPDFVFSFYYRHMLTGGWLGVARRGALNMHGSLLPKYRGRVPVNWAIIKGERETGASLHHMAIKPDAGNLVAQQRVPILPDDTAADVFRKVCVAAELCLDGALPGLLDGSAPSVPLDLAKGSYFGGRKAEDGRIDWRQGALDIHNLVRAVAPPYPGAWMDLDGHRWIIERTRVLAGRRGPHASPTLYGDGGTLLAQAGDGGVLRVFELTIDGVAQDVAATASRLAVSPLPLPLAPPATAAAARS